MAPSANLPAAAFSQYHQVARPLSPATIRARTAARKAAAAAAAAQKKLASSADELSDGCSVTSTPTDASDSELSHALSGSNTGCTSSCSIAFAPGVEDGKLNLQGLQLDALDFVGDDLLRTPEPGTPEWTPRYPQAQQELQMQAPPMMQPAPPVPLSPPQLSEHCQGPESVSWYRVAFLGGLDLRVGPNINLPRAGVILPQHEIFPVSRVVNIGDGRVYLELADGRGWAFDDSALIPHDPAVVRLEPSHGVQMQIPTVIKPTVAGHTQATPEAWRQTHQNPTVQCQGLLAACSTLPLPRYLPGVPQAASVELLPPPAHPPVEAVPHHPHPHVEIPQAVPHHPQPHVEIPQVQRTWKDNKPPKGCPPPGCWKVPAASVGR